ncbi:SHOCT domain-containing protein [Dactylosporangium sp. NPDC000244]|uniref:SHOCT domain-containing protein n=1 Tax=Dactylosporangium sp. NPDC000244 TaxID=3154365 RepID=UPI003332A618
MMYWGTGMGAWTMAFMTLGNLLFWALVIVGIVMLVRRFDRRTPPNHATRSGPDSGPLAHQILDERFARGEIDEDEYVRRRRMLDGQPTADPSRQ